ncbi:crossover junction endonuclease EME1B isoform X1 [Musa acuminata AAA Group]|uniref:crossover junction endonuclease EME1B isoform X1 n=1 Tax=Musa acuminata AAA Group TaxID=214697 RepID=UPI0031CEBB61
MDRRPLPPPAVAVDISSPSPSPRRPKKRQQLKLGGSGGPPPTLVVIDDDLTPQKADATRTPSFVAETPLSPGFAFDSDPSVVKCSLSRAKFGNASSDKFAGITGLICLESDNESELGAHLVNVSKQDTTSAFSTPPEHAGTDLRFHRAVDLKVTGAEKDHDTLCFPIDDAVSDSYYKNNKDIIQDGSHGVIDDCIDATSSFVQIVGASPLHGCCMAKEALLQTGNHGDDQDCMFDKEDFTGDQNCKGVIVDARKNHKTEADERKKKLKEEKRHLLEERKRQKQQEKLKKEALKSEAAEAKKLEKERQKWEKGKFALKSILAEIDVKVIENGSVGGHLLTRFAEKGLSFRVTSNPVERSIMWKMNVPDHIAKLSPLGSEVPYILLVSEAEEFCDLVITESFFDSIHRVQSQYPTFTICYLINKLTSYIKKCEQNQYKNPSNASCWKCPPVEEILSKLTTHYSNVHSRQCIDEAELAEHVVGLTCSLANCQFRKKLTWLSVHANGSIVPKDFIDKNLTKKSVWLKALIAIPKVQPRHAVAIWKKYPTMRSLLNVYMDPNKSVHEKEFLLKDLMVTGIVGTEDRRLGEICSKRVYRVLMAQTGGIKTDDVEEGADFFHC